MLLKENRQSVKRSCRLYEETAFPVGSKALKSSQEKEASALF
jgi:transcriptional regulator of heat shock response